MRFSILIPVYNVERYLEECINSILSQEYQSYEIILVDDGSTDSSGKICDDYKKENPDIIKVIHQQNKGLFATRRVAFDAAEGEYCICVDSDDFLEKGALGELSRIIDEHSPDFILYDLFTYNMSTNTSQREEMPLISNQKYDGTDVLKDGLLYFKFTNWSMCSKCIKTKLAKCDFDFSPYLDISYGEDTVQSIVLYNITTNFVYSDSKIYNYRIGSGMTKKKPIKWLEDFYRIVTLMVEECSEWTDDIRTATKDYFSRIYLIYIDDVIKNSETAKKCTTRAKEADKFVDDIGDVLINYLYCSNKLKRILLKLKMYKLLYFFVGIRR